MLAVKEEKESQLKIEIMEKSNRNSTEKMQYLKLKILMQYLKVENWLITRMEIMDKIVSRPEYKKYQCPT